MTQTDHLRRLERVLPLSGAAFSALMVAAAAAFPMPPGGDVTPASQPTWLAAHSSAVIEQGYVRAVAAVAFVGLVAAVAAAVRRATSERSALPGAALLGGSLTGGMLLLAQSVGLSSTLFSRGGGSADTVRALGRLQAAVLDMSSLPAVLLFTAVGLASLRTGILPRWLTVVTLVGVPFAVLDAGSYEGGPLESLGLVGLVYFLAWSLLVGVSLMVRTTQQSAPPDRQVATAAA